LRAQFPISVSICVHSSSVAPSSFPPHSATSRDDAVLDKVIY
jgi:hypothetical protein